MRHELELQDQYLYYVLLLNLDTMHILCISRFFPLYDKFSCITGGLRLTTRLTETYLNRSVLMTANCSFTSCQTSWFMSVVAISRGRQVFPRTVDLPFVSRLFTEIDHLVALFFVLRRISSLCCVMKTRCHWKWNESAMKLMITSFFFFFIENNHFSTNFYNLSHIALCLTILDVLFK